MSTGDHAMRHARLVLLAAAVMLLWTRAPTGAAPAPAVELNRNLLANGDFSRLEDGHPVGWDYWDPKYTRVIQMEGREGNVVEIDQDRYVAAFDGVQVYSRYIPIREGVRYRFSVDLMSQGAHIILWVKGYGPSNYRGRPLEMDELYRSQHQIHGLKAGQWRRETVHYLVKPPEEYTNIPHQKITHVRVMFYCYWPAKKCYMADARFEAVELWEPPPKPIVDPATAPTEETPKAPTEEEAFTEAKNLFWRQQWAEALVATDKLVAMNPQNAVYGFLRFRLYFRTRRLDDCLKEIARTASIAKEDSAYMKSWFALFRARVARQRGDAAGARKAYAEAVRLASDETAVDQARQELAKLGK